MKFRFTPLSGVWRYGIAIAAPLAALVLRLPLVPVLGDRAPMILLPVAVVFAAWLGGLGPGLVATVFGTLLAFSQLLFSGQPIPALPAVVWARVILFLFIGAALSAMAEAMHRARRKEHQRAEALRESEQRYRSLFDNNLDAIFSLDAEGRFSTANAAAERLSGYTLDELKKLHFLELCAPEHRDESAQAFRAGFCRQCSDFETAMIRKDGARVELFVTGAPVVLDGTVVGVACIARDITARKAADEAVRHSEGLLRSITDHTDDIIFVKDRDLRFEFMNPAGFRAAALPPEKILGRTDAEIHRDQVEAAGYMAADRRVMETRTVETIEETFTSDTGQKHIFLTTKTPRLDPAGNVIGIIGIAHDITARKTAELALRESDQRLGGIIGSAMDAIITVDDEQRIVLFNPAAEKMFQHSAASVLGQPLEQLIPARFRAGHADHVRRFGEAGTTSRQMGALGRLSALRADGEEFPIEASISQIEIGAEKFFTVILRDITERERGEEALRSAKRAAEAASKAKDNFLAALSHELRNPLNPALLAASELQHDERLPNDVREEIEMIHRNIALEARLIDDLLDLTRIARGRLALRTERCDAHTLLGHSLEIVQAEIATKNLTLAQEFAAQVPWIDADPARLQQVFWNLLKNAVKFTPRGGHIRVSTRNDGGRLFIEVVDTGIGFEAEAGARIFDSFEQGDLANDHRFGGLGLGLAISKAVIDQLGGRISASSEGHNRGATFRVELATSARRGIEASEAGPETAARSVGTDGSGEPTTGSLCLLVVEDHAPTLDLLRRLLSRAGHRVTCTESIAAALDAARAAGFDAVISDIGLPDGSGHDLLRQLRTLQPGLGAIALSGYGMEEDLQLSRESGFDAHLVKPIDFVLLKRALEQVAAATSG